MKVRVFACLSYDAVLGTWEKSRYKYTLEEIAGFANSKPILEEWEDVERPDAAGQMRNMTGAFLRD